MTDRELDEIIVYWWPTVLRRAMAGTDQWLQSFARSIAKHAKRSAWHPTPKQAYLMRKLVADAQAAPEADSSLIEEDDAP